MLEFWGNYMVGVMGILVSENFFKYFLCMFYVMIGVLL